MVPPMLYIFIAEYVLVLETVVLWLRAKDNSNAIV